MKTFYIVIAVLVLLINIYLFIKPNGINNQNMAGKLIYLVLFLGTLFVILYNKF